MYDIVDLTQEIYTGQPVFHGHPETTVEYAVRHEDAASAPNRLVGLTYEAMFLQMCDHGPTHVDSISHIDERAGAPTIDEMPLEWFMTRAIALDFTGRVEPREVVPLELLQEELQRTGLTPPRDGTFLFTCGHYRRTYPGEAYVFEYPGLSKDAAEFLYRECGVINVGQDAPTVDARVNTEKNEYPCHVLCRELQRTNTENLANIEEVAGKEFLYVGLPLKVRKGTGSPIRAVAVLDL